MSLVTHSATSPHTSFLAHLGISFSNSDLMAIAIAVFCLTYVLILLENVVHRVAAALLGACAVVLFGVMTPAQAWQSIDFNTLFLLFGMMNIVNILQKSGFFNLVAAKALALTDGNPARVLWIFGGLTAILSALLDNVTTVLFMTPVLLGVIKKLELKPLPYLVALILSSNLGGAATLIGDPPNIIIGSAAGFGFMDFVKNVAPFVTISTVIGLGLMHLSMKKRGELISTHQLSEKDTSLENIEVDKRLMYQGLSVFTLTLILFSIGHSVGLEAGTIAMLGMTILMIISKADPHALFEKVEWTTLLFFMGLFVVVGGLEHTGIFNILSGSLIALIGERTDIGILGIGFGGALMSGFVDNIPFTMSMSSLLKEMGQNYPNIDPLWWALSLGACLGGNLTLIGASANIVVGDIAIKEGVPLNFWNFVKYGTLIALATTTVALLLFYGAYLLGYFS